MDCSAQDDDEYKEKRKAIQEHNGGNKTEATDFLDFLAEQEILSQYLLWLEKCSTEAEVVGDRAQRKFHNELPVHITNDWGESAGQVMMKGWEFEGNGKGGYKVFDRGPCIMRSSLQA